MSPPRIPRLPLDFYPFPPIYSKFHEATVYIGIPLFAWYYKAYEMPIDPTYRLDLYDKRFDNPPYMPEKYGEEWGYIHNCLTDDIMKGIFYRSSVVGMTFKEAIETHRAQYHFIRKTNILLPSVNLVIDYSGKSKDILHKFLGQPYFEYQNIVLKAIDTVVPGGKVVTQNANGKVISYLRRLGVNADGTVTPKKRRFRFY